MEESPPLRFLASELLPGLRLLATWLRKRGVHVALAPPVRLVVDANRVASDLAYSCRYPDQVTFGTVLERCAISGVAQLYAPQHLLDDLKSAVPNVARETGFPAASLWEKWAEYREAIIIVPVHARHYDVAASRLDLRDPSDKPYLYLYDLLGAHGLLTGDKDLIAEPSVRTFDPQATTLLLRALERYAAERALDLVQKGVAVGGGLGVVNAIHIVPGALDSAKRIWAKFPPWARNVLIGVVVAAALSLLHPGVRAWLKEKIAAAVDALRAALGSVSEFIKEVALETALASSEVKRVIESAQEILDAASVPPKLEQGVASIVLTEDRPIPLEVLQFRLGELGLDPDRVSEREILRVLGSELPPVYREVEAGWTPWWRAHEVDPDDPIANGSDTAGPVDPPLPPLN